MNLRPEQEDLTMAREQQIVEHLTDGPQTCSKIALHLNARRADVEVMLGVLQRRNICVRRNGWWWLSSFDLIPPIHLRNGESSLPSLEVAIREQKPEPIVPATAKDRPEVHPQRGWTPSVAFVRRLRAEIHDARMAIVFHDRTVGEIGDFLHAAEQVLEALGLEEVEDDKGDGDEPA